MKKNGAKTGRFSVEFEVTDNADRILAERGMLPEDQVRHQTISGIVDPGTAMLVLPQSVAKSLGVSSPDKINVRYADGRKALRPKAEGVYVEPLNRHDTFTAIVEPNRKTALLGAIVLEALDLLVDCNNQRLIPRDPRWPVYEIE